MIETPQPSVEPQPYPTVSKGASEIPIVPIAIGVGALALLAAIA